MARRKRILEDEDDSDSSGVSDGGLDLDNDPDAREERALFENPYQRKRRRRNGKEDALYGIFGEDSDDEDRVSRGGKVSEKKSDWTKAPAFVSGQKVSLDKSVDVDVGNMEAGKDSDENNDDDDNEEDEGGGEGDDTDEYESSRPPSPRVREDDEDNLPDTTVVRGIGSRSNNQPAEALPGLGLSHMGELPSETLSSVSRGGIGSSRPSIPKTFPDSDDRIDDDISRMTTSKSTSAASKNLPSAFGKRSFVSKSSTPLKPAEAAHFSKLQGTFGARMLAKMGWQAGEGLGATGEGIVTPVESKLRPQKIGIAFKGFKEKTEQSKMEARRRGEKVVSDDEDEGKLRRGGKTARADNRSDAWKRPKKVKVKVEHKTYEQILAEAGQDAPPGIGMIIDATGATPKEVSSLADVSLNPWSPSNDPTRIPEVRHNVRLIADACKSDLDGLAREAKVVEERKKWVANEDLRLRRKIAEETELIARLQKIQLVADEISVKSKELASMYEVSLEPFSPIFYNIVDHFSEDVEKYHLDEIVVGAILPIIRRMIAQWNPLEQPSTFVSTFRNWRVILRINSQQEKPPESQIDVYGSKTIVAAPVQLEKPMTAFESLLWNVWLPKVRSSINNDWAPQNPQPAVKLYEVWSSFLPPFIRDNFLDQLILPKVQKAVADWHPRKETVSLQAVVFPWLPYIGLRLEDLVGDAKRKIKSLLRSWTTRDDIPMDLIAWKDVFDHGDWDTMILKYVVPKLSATLRDDFHINPRDQQMEPLQHVLLWSEIVRPSIFSQILEKEFFPKWLDILHVWLIQPRVSFEEVVQWYEFWKHSFPQSVQSMPGVSHGFTRGLQLMNKAIELGPDAPARLPRPDHNAVEQSSAPTVTKAPRRKLAARTHEITFRSIVEEFAASHNLLFVPTGRAHATSRMPLFRVSPTSDGKGGLLVYILDDAVWAPLGTNLGGDGDEYRAITLDDMVLRASRS